MPSGENITRERGLLRLQEAAALLGLQPSSLRAWVFRRRVPVVRLSARCIRFRKADLEAIIADRLVPARPEAE
jgi:excisionase family DNA binding protein